MITAETVIEQLGLVPLGFEGGYYRETSRSASTVDLGRGERALSTSIFYMLTPDSFGLMHRLASDEVYHFYLGDTVELLMLHPDGTSEVVRLGQDLTRGERVQLRVPAGTWQGSRLREGGRFALMGTTMSPGFELADFELGDRDQLTFGYPDQAALLRVLTPERLLTDRLEMAAATLDLIHAELRSKEALGAGLRARIPKTWPPPLNDERTLRFVLERLSGDREQRGWWSWYLVDKASRDAIGVVGFKGPPDDAGLVEIGYSVLPEHQGKGYATEAVTALSRWAAARGATRLRAETMPELAASIRVLEKLGFEQVDSEPGVLRFERTAR